MIQVFIMRDLKREKSDNQFITEIITISSGWSFNICLITNNERVDRSTRSFYLWMPLAASGRPISAKIVSLSEKFVSFSSRKFSIFFFFFSHEFGHITKILIQINEMKMSVNVGTK